MAESNHPIVSLADVAQHKTRAQGVWIALNGVVYDVTQFLDDHPGGPEILMEYAGTDATTTFEEIGHSKPAYTMMTKYAAGQLPAGEGVRLPVRAAPAPAPSVSSPVKTLEATWTAWSTGVQALFDKATNAAASHPVKNSGSAAAPAADKSVVTGAAAVAEASSSSAPQLEARVAQLTEEVRCLADEVRGLREGAAKQLIALTEVMTEQRDVMAALVQAVMAERAT